MAGAIDRLGKIAMTSSALEKEKKPLAEWVKTFFGQSQIGKAISGDWTANYYSAARTTIKADKLNAALLKRGIQPTVISEILAESSDHSDSFTLRVSPIKEPA